MGGLIDQAKADTENADILIKVLIWVSLYFENY